MNQVLELRAQLEGIVTKWLGDRFAHEPFESQMVRAMLEANSCSMTQAEISRGEQPIRPLESFLPFK